MIALIIFPFPTALIYLVPRGREWRSARRREVRQAQADTESYIQQVAGRAAQPNK